MNSIKHQIGCLFKVLNYGLKIFKQKFLLGLSVLWRARARVEGARSWNARVRKVFLVVFVSRRIMFAVKTRQVEFPKILANF